MLINFILKISKLILIFNMKREVDKLPYSIIEFFKEYYGSPVFRIGDRVRVSKKLYVL